MDNFIQITKKKVLDEWDLDEWSIGKITYNKILDTIPIGKTILEFGSGAGTGKLAVFYKMISIEENIEYLNKYDSQYIHVPIVSVKNKYHEFMDDEVWFDEKIFREKLASVDTYDAILIDGPKGYRGGLYYNLDVLKLDNKWIIFDDVHDKFHYKLMELISKRLNKSFIVYEDGMKKFGIIRP
jgi:hypothetical protein